jgi:hypothetical protein
VTETSAIIQLIGYPATGKLTIARTMAELARRVTGAGRREHHKLTDPDIVREYATDRRLHRPDVDGRIDLDVTDLTAEQAATQILDTCLR